MRQIALALAGTAALLTAAEAQAPAQTPGASQQSCDKLVTRLEQGGTPPSEVGLTLRMARDWQALGYDVGCRFALDRLDRANGSAAGDTGAATRPDAAMPPAQR